MKTSFQNEDLTPKNFTQIFRKIGEMLNFAKENGTTDMWYDDERILSPHKNDISWLTTFLDELIQETGCGWLTRTGYYDPAEDAREGVHDKYTGMYYLEIE